MLPRAAAQFAACVGLHVIRHRFLLFLFVLSLLLLLVILFPPGPTTITTSSSPVDPTLFLSCLHRSIRFSPGPTVPSSFSVVRPPPPCGPHSNRQIEIKILSRPLSLSLLRNATVLFAGDSQCRLLLLSLLRLLLLPSDFPSAASALSRRHSDFHTFVPSHSISLHFLWSPFESNISSSLHSLLRSPRPYPHLLVAGSGLWHMLHVTSPDDYGRNLRAIRSSAAAGAMGVGARSRMFWVGLPVLVEGMLNTEEKRRRMTRTVLKAYLKEVEKSGILRQDGGVFGLLDVGWLSGECGARCTEDGMHYSEVVYDAAVQVMLNAVESGQSHW